MGRAQLSLCLKPKLTIRVIDLEQVRVHRGTGNMANKPPAGEACPERTLDMAEAIPGVDATGYGRGDGADDQDAEDGAPIREGDDGHFPMAWPNWLVG